MNKQNELKFLNNLITGAELTGKNNIPKQLIYSVANILLFAAIAYIYLDVKAGHFGATIAIVICVILGVISGILFMSRLYNKYAIESAKYLNVEKIKARINELNT